MNSRALLWASVVGGVVGSPGVMPAEQELRGKPVPVASSVTGWYGALRSGFVYQVPSMTDQGGEFLVNRFALEAALGYRPNLTRNLAFTLGYDLSDYRLSGSASAFPWSEVHMLKVGAPIRWGLDDRWTLYVIPTLRWTLEGGAEWKDALSGGGFTGFTYRFGARLTIGPGFGALTQLGASPTVFPVVLIRWDITDRIRLETGRGLGASQGPGLTLSYSFTEDWRLALGGRYEKYRFRLSSSGAGRNGIGEDRGVPIYVGISRTLGSRATVSVLGGVRFGGELQLEDASGRSLSTTTYDSAPFLGLTVDLRL